MMPQIPPKRTTRAEPPYNSNGSQGGQERAADRTPRLAPLDIADLGTQLLVPPELLQRQQGKQAEIAQEHERRATQLRREVAKIQEAERELAAFERELDMLWRTPSGLLSEEDRERIRYLSGAISLRRPRLLHASEQIADRIVRAQRHEAAAVQLRAENTREQ
jgi:hypothetical protein